MRGGGAGDASVPLSIKPTKGIDQMKNTRKGMSTVTKLALMSGVLALGTLFSAMAIPPVPANGWITYTYYNGEGEVVGERSEVADYCNGMQPYEWGVRTRIMTWRTGSCGPVE
jgi:hypothetical protein